MKKVILALFVLIISTGTLIAQTQIPHHVMDAFKQTHPFANYATWTTEGVNFKVSYFDDSKMQNFKVYDSNDQVISHTYEVIGNVIPAEITAHYQKMNAIDGSYKVWIVVDKNGNKSYSADYNNVITNFDKSGSIQK
ncbi:MAG: hypothetical protein KBF92_01290 [Bacteroidia bacterium]|nr:hypothetical protein [Bacteroidota bacterium]MBP9789231.1 hypothetical protein [Bacteroidia bacterium]MBK7430104.1 hypothetical protein [Bacteroidota bacterium]MBK7572330.1 hypothetical protein [Bacteroidota bacterium]MBP9922436.1 hypothetical protein [Bacteroidia bacterium]